MAKSAACLTGAVLLVAAVACGVGDSAPAATPEATGDGTGLLAESGLAARTDDEATAETAQADLNALRAAAERDPSDLQTKARLAVTLFEMRETDEALALFEEIAQEKPDATTLLNLGQAYVRLSRYPEAERTYARVLEMRPGHPVALHSLGNIAMRRGQADRAIEFYRQAITQRPDYILAWFHLADALKEAGQYRDAYATYAGVLELEPKDRQELDTFDDALYEMASLDITMGAHERAVGMLEELLRANPNHKSAYYAYGQALLQMGREDEAQAAFRRHLEIRSKIKPDSPMAMGD